MTFACSMCVCVSGGGGVYAYVCKHYQVISKRYILFVESAEVFLQDPG